MWKMKLLHLLKSVPKGTTRIRQAIIHLGNELVAENYVQLSKEGGLNPSDVKVNVQFYIVYIYLFSFFPRITANYRTHSETTTI